VPSLPGRMSGPLPPGWYSGTSRGTGQLYYVNGATGESTHRRPLHPSLALPTGWEVAYSRTDGKPYYYNQLTNTSQFEFPGSTTAATLDYSRLQPELANLAKARAGRAAAAARRGDTGGTSGGICGCSMRHRHDRHDSDGSDGVVRRLELRVGELEAEVQSIRSQLAWQRVASIDSGVRRARSRGSARALQIKQRLFNAWHHVVFASHRGHHRAMKMLRNSMMSRAFAGWHASWRQARKRSQDQALAQLTDIVLADKRFQGDFSSSPRADDGWGSPPDVLWPAAQASAWGATTPPQLSSWREAGVGGSPPPRAAAGTMRMATPPRRRSLIHNARDNKWQQVPVSPQLILEQMRDG
jgi:hypothetical protein